MLTFCLATDVEGIFRLAGAERRVKELQAIFNSPERYGKGLDWTGYTVHDASHILRRYLNQLPEPVVPTYFYERFREPLKHHQGTALGQNEPHIEGEEHFDFDAAVRSYKTLITELPPLNRQLLLYLLDLLAVFASKSDLNLMDSHNLSSIFQPALLQHPDHAMSPPQYALNQKVLIFLIDNQDNFIVGMDGTAADEKTIQEVQSGAPKPASGPGTPGGRNSQALGRSSSTASAGADSVRRFGGIRRNVSVSSKRSRQSANSPSPVTPPPDSAYSKGSGVHRSNTVPSKKSPSPALSSSRFRRKSPDVKGSPLASQPASSDATKPTSGRMSPHLRPVVPIHSRRETSKDRQLKMDMPSSSRNASPAGTPSRERTFTNFFKQSPTSDAEKKDGKKPNKLQKRRPDAGTLNAQTSNQSLSGTSYPSSPAHGPFKGNTVIPEDQVDTIRTDSTATTATSGNQVEPKEFTLDAPTPTAAAPSGSSAFPAHAAEDSRQTPVALADLPQRDSALTVKPSPRPSTSSETGYSSADRSGDESSSSKKKRSKHSRWFSRSEKREGKGNGSNANLATSTVGAGPSTSSVGSVSRTRKSFTDESYKSTTDGEGGQDSKKGPLSWFKGKIQEAKERAKSPPRGRRSPRPSQSMDSALVSDSRPDTGKLSEASDLTPKAENKTIDEVVPAGEATPKAV